MRIWQDATLWGLLLCGTVGNAYAQTPSREDLPAPVDNSGRKQLSEYLNGLAAQQNEDRRKLVAAIATREGAEARQQHVRETMLRLLGTLPTRSPLNARTTGSTAMDGFRVDKILFDSRPGFTVTALLYVPVGENGGAKFPAIVMAPGHSPAGKAGDVATATAFARAGFVVLSYDPIGQGERLQYPDPNNPGHTLSKAPTGEHGEAGLQPTLIGDAVAQYFLWDGMRAVDYLQARAEVDGRRIGAFGCSGGGAMTALLGALDPRVAAVGTACYWTNYDTLLPSIGPQDAEQSIPGFAAAGLDFPDWVEVAAPKRYAMIATTSDMFPFAGAKVTEAEARRFYGLLGAGDRLQFITGPGGHGNLRPILPQILRFFVDALHPDAAYAKNLPPVSDPFAADATPRTAGARPGPPPQPPLSLTQVTPTGQVATSFPGSATVFTLNKAKADAVRTPNSRSEVELQNAVRAVTKAEAVPGQSKPAVVDRERVGAQDHLVVRLAPGQDMSLRVLPIEGRHPATLYLTDTPAGLSRTEHTRALVNSAHSSEVFIFTPRPSPPGTEESKSPLLGDFYLTELRAELVGRTLLGLRVDDVIRMVDYIASRPEVDARQITLVANGHMATVALHAAILDRRVAHVTDSGLRSYRDVVNDPLPKDAPQDVLPGVLPQYDLPDLRRILGARLMTASQADTKDK